MRRSLRRATQPLPKGDGLYPVVRPDLDRPDDTQAVSATVQITANLQASFDTLAVSGTAIGGTIFGTNIVVTSYDSSTGTLTLTGTDTLANYQAAPQKRYLQQHK